MKKNNGLFFLSWLLICQLQAQNPTGPITIPGTNLGITVHNQNMQNNTAIILHEGLNQWIMLSDGAIVEKDRPRLGLTVLNQNVSNGAKIILHEGYNTWKVLSNGAIVLKDNPSYGLTVLNQNKTNNAEIILHQGYNTWSGPIASPPPPPPPAPAPVAPAPAAPVAPAPPPVPVDRNAINPATQMAEIHTLARSGETDKVVEQVKLGANVNLKEGTKGQTPLHIAVSQRNTALASALITQCSADINLKDNQNKTPLDIALETSDNATAKLLLDNNANAGLCTTGLDRVIQLKDNEMLKRMLQNHADANLVISKAIATDNEEILRTALTNGNVRASNAQFESALQQQSKGCAKALLENGIDVNQAMDASIAKRDRDFIEIILKKSDIDVGSKNKALIFAVEQRDVTFATKMILDYHANPTSGMAKAVETNNLQMVNLLLNNGADANDQIDEVSTQGKNDLLTAMLQKGGDANLGVALAATNDKTSTLKILLDNRGDANLAMPIAINKGSLPMVQMCLAAQPPADVTNSQYVVKACELSNYDILNALLMALAPPDPGMPISIPKGDARLVELMIKAGASAAPADYLVTACTRKDEPIVKLLLSVQAPEKKADPNVGMPISIEQGSAGIVSMLLEAGADGTRPQFIDNASAKGHDAIVSSLLKSGADPNNGMMSAVKNNKASTVSILIAGGADGSKDIYMATAAPHNNTALMGALVNAGGRPEVALLPAIDADADKVVQFLNQKGVPITDVSYLETCVKKNHAATARVLVAAGASAAEWWDGAKGVSLLHIAIEQHMNPDLVASLIKAGSDVKKPTTIGENSPLHVTVMNAKKRWDEAGAIVKLLIAAGADVNAVNGDGKTVLKESPDRPVLQKPLKEAGAKNKLD